MTKLPKCLGPGLVRKVNLYLFLAMNVLTLSQIEGVH